MSKASVSKVVQRAIGDAAFRRQLQRDPDHALAGFDLTKDERAAITSGDPARLTALGVDQRMSKAFGIGALGDASKVIVGDTQSAGSAAFIDEGTTAGGAALVSPNTAEGGSASLISADGVGIDAGFVSGESAGNAGIIGDPAAATTAAFETGNAMGDGTAAFDPGTVSAGTSAFEPMDASGDGTAAFDPGAPTGGYAAEDPGDLSTDAPSVHDLGGDVHLTDQ